MKQMARVVRELVTDQQAKVIFTAAGDTAQGVGQGVAEPASRVSAGQSYEGC